jgi:hypothetical protein
MRTEEKDMPLSSVLSSAVSGLASSAERAGCAAERIVTADVPKQAQGSGGNGGGLDVQDTISLSDPSLARTQGLVELSQAETSFKANAAVVRAADEQSERLLDITA